MESDFAALGNLATHGILSAIDFSSIDGRHTSKLFAQLFEERRGVVDNGAYMLSKAHEVFSGTTLVLSEGMPSAPSDGALLGIAFYSLPDLVILDAVVEQSRNSSHVRNMQVEIFDILTFKSMQDVEALLPGLTPA